MVLKLSKEQGEQIRALHAAGKGRNEITRMLGLTSANVTNFCKANGLTFTSSKSLEVARESRSAEMREQRARIAKNAADIAERLQARLMGKTYSYYHHHKNDELVRVELPEAPLRDMGAGLSAINTSMGTHLAILPTLGSKSAANEMSMLDRLNVQMKGVVSEWDDSESDEDDTEIDG